jgi:hypothetical protein
METNNAPHRGGEGLREAEFIVPRAEFNRWSSGFRRFARGSSLSQRLLSATGPPTECTSPSDV